MHLSSQKTIFGAVSAWGKLNPHVPQPISLTKCGTWLSETRKLWNLTPSDKQRPRPAGKPRTSDILVQYREVSERSINDTRYISLVSCVYFTLPSFLQESVNTSSLYVSSLKTTLKPAITLLSWNLSKKPPCLRVTSRDRWLGRIGCLF